MFYEVFAEVDGAILCWSFDDLLGLVDVAY